MTTPAAEGGRRAGEVQAPAPIAWHSWQLCQVTSSEGRRGGRGEGQERIVAGEEGKKKEKQEKETCWLLGLHSVQEVRQSEEEQSQTRRVISSVPLQCASS